MSDDLVERPRGELGRLVPPFPAKLCAADHCRATLNTDTEAHLFTDHESGKMIVFCGACATTVELPGSLRFQRVAL